LNGLQNNVKKTEDELARGVKVTDPIVVPQDEVDAYEAQELGKKRDHDEVEDDADYEVVNVDGLNDIDDRDESSDALYESELDWPELS